MTKPIDELDMAEIVREAVNRLPGGFIIYGPNHEILLANEQNERDFPVMNRHLRAGLSYHDAIYNSVINIMPDIEHDAVVEITRNIVSALDGGEPVELKTSQGTIKSNTLR